jgi:thioesterase domain-containing protein
MDAEARFDFLFDKAAAAEVVPPDLGPNDLKRLFAIFKANVLAMDSYVPRSAPVQAMLFKALDSSGAEARDDGMGWKELAQGGVEVHHVPGSHYSLLREPNTQFIASRLRERLDQIGEQ